MCAHAHQIHRVIPANAGIHLAAASATLETKMDSRVRGNDAGYFENSAIDPLGTGKSDDYPSTGSAISASRIQ
jgi:hypothetical protein